MVTRVELPRKTLGFVMLKIEKDDLEKKNEGRIVKL